MGGAGVEGDTGPLLSRLSVDLGMERHLRLVGPRPHEEVAEWLAAADLFCLATSNEGMANVLVEALSSGLPVVTTRVGGNAELISAGANGLLVPPGDAAALQSALHQALQTSWDRNRIAGAMTGRTWEASAAQIVREWDGLLGAIHDKGESPNLSTAA